MSLRLAFVLTLSFFWNEKLVLTWMLCDCDGQVVERTSRTAAAADLGARKRQDARTGACRCSFVFFFLFASLYDDETISLLLRTRVQEQQLGARRHDEEAAKTTTTTSMTSMTTATTTPTTTTTTTRGRPQ